MKKPDPTFETVTVPAFRAWLGIALERTKLSAPMVARGMGVGINSVSVFQRDPNRDITMGRAAELERYLRNAAADLRVSLPTIADAARLEGVSDV